MKFDTPATENPIDRLKVVGRPTNRIDGPLNTSGTAPYAYERHDLAPNQDYGYVVRTALDTGRIFAIDTQAAFAAPVHMEVGMGRPAGKTGRGSFNTQRV